MKKNKIYFLVLLLVAMVGCSEDEDSNVSSNQPLQGTVFNENFVATGGKAFDSSFGDTERVSINITNIVVDCDSSIFDYDLYVSSTVPFEVGTYEESNVVFHKEGETPLNVLQSTVIIEEITDTTITVRIESEASFSENQIEGTFTVDYCE